MHCHTVQGSADSQLTPEDLAKTLAAMAACCVSEHDNVWPRHEAERYANQTSIPFIRGMEVTTDLGHILVYGLDQYVSGIHDARALRHRVLAEEGIMIAAHPPRNVLYKKGQGESDAQTRGPSLEEAAGYEIFGLVDEVEVLNGGTAELENLFALRVAQKLGFRGVACSDAHLVNGIGRYVTMVQREVTTVEQLIDEVKAGRFYAAEVSYLPERTVVPYTEDSLDPQLAARLRSTIELGV